MFLPVACWLCCAHCSAVAWSGLSYLCAARDCCSWSLPSFKSTWHLHCRCRTRPCVEGKNWGFLTSVSLRKIKLLGPSCMAFISSSFSCISTSKIAERMEVYRWKKPSNFLTARSSTEYLMEYQRVWKVVFSMFFTVVLKFCLICTLVYISMEKKRPLTKFIMRHYLSAFEMS